MKIILDVMSGDNAPIELIRGASLAADEYHAEIVIVGREEIIRRVSKDEKIDISKLKIVNAPDVITMDDNPLVVVRGKPESSMSVGLHLLADGKGDAFVSAGNTGALLAGATLIVRRIKGIQRAGIATVLPLSNPVLLMDAGANLEVNANNLEQFAFMGSKYMEKILDVKNPRVGLLNNGTESGKGLPLQREAFVQLSDAEVNFVGNVEAKSIPLDACDVIVTDGFTGNIVLKYTEGMAKFMMMTLKDLFYTNAITKVSALTMKKPLQNLKRSFDASEYGGAPILGISKPVIKAHGSSDAKAIKNAIRQAIEFSASGLNRDISRFAIDYDDRMKERAKLRKLMAKMQEKAEKAEQKRKEKEEKAAKKERKEQKD